MVSTTSLAKCLPELANAFLLDGRELMGLRCTAKSVLAWMPTGPLHIAELAAMLASDVCSKSFFPKVRLETLVAIRITASSAHLPKVAQCIGQVSPQLASKAPRVKPQRRK